jgi:hypothetical protein
VTPDHSGAWPAEVSSHHTGQGPALHDEGDEPNPAQGFSTSKAHCSKLAASGGLERSLVVSQNGTGGITDLQRLEETV